jgi:hypothetical protein
MQKAQLTKPVSWLKTQNKFSRRTVLKGPPSLVGLFSLLVVVQVFGKSRLCVGLA